MTACCSFIHPESSCLCVAWDLMCTRHELTGMPRKTLRVIGPVWRSFKSFKKKQDSHHPSLTGTSAQQTQTNHKKKEKKTNPPWISVSRLFQLFSCSSRLRPALQPDTVCKMRARMCGAAPWSLITSPNAYQ